MPCWHRLPCLPTGRSLRRSGLVEDTAAFVANTSGRKEDELGCIVIVRYLVAILAILISPIPSAPQTYADYYYVEALIRLKKLLSK